MNELIHLIKNDYEVILTGMGILIILAGLILFISGRYSDKESRMEGFGIKMDVKNPSLILIIVGVVLLITSATMKQGGETEKKVAAPQKSMAQSEKSVAPETLKRTPTVKRESVSPQIMEKPTTPRAYENEPSEAPIVGEYQLATYIENGVPLNVTGSLQIGQPHNHRFPFDVQYQAVDMYGNMFVVTYSGYLIQRNGHWFLKIEGSSDVEWTDIGEVPMQVIYDNSVGSMGMRYFYDADVASVWQKVTAR